MGENAEVALVTGATRGIGREVARQPADRGYRVIVSARDLGKAETFATEIGGGAIALELDVGDPASTAAAVTAISADPGRLDVLVNNAGVGLDWGVPATEPDFDVIKETAETNLFGAYRLAVGLLPLLRASDHPRIVNVSSGMGGLTEMGGGSPAYRLSKAGLNVVTRMLSAELADDGFRVNSACPGFVKTDMGTPLGAWKSVEDGAAGIVWLATLPDDGPTGGFFRDGEALLF